MGIFGKLFGVVAGSNPWEWVALALAVVIALGSCFGAGYYEGSNHVTTQVINASATQIANARAEGVKAQADKDQKDEIQKRVEDAKENAALEAANKKLKALLAHKIANPTHAFVPAADMKLLNDPALVGKTEGELSQ